MVKKVICLLLLLAVCPLAVVADTDEKPLPEVEFFIDEKLFQDGDIIFQAEPSSQRQAIQLATHSPYSHCGIIFWQNARPYVFEAISTVGFTPLRAWIERGIDRHYVLMRLKDHDRLLSAQLLRSMKGAALSFKGKSYDSLFQWSDARIYCSELVWKVYDRGASMQLTILKTLRDYDLNHEQVRKIAYERFGSDLPWDEKVVAPADIMESSWLEVVAEN